MRKADPRHEYQEEVFGLKDDFLKSIRGRMAESQCERISISSSEAALLQFFIRQNGVKSIVEVGTLFGYSAVAMAMALPPGGVVHTIEKNPANYEHAARTFGACAWGSKIRSLKGDAMVVLRELENAGPFDMIFIDGNKNDYYNYLMWAEKNVRQGGLIVGDNTFLFGGVYGEVPPSSSAETVEVMKKFNARLADTSLYDGVMIPTNEGLTVAVKKFAP